MWVAGRYRPCGRPPAEHIETSSDAVNPGAPCRAARPCPQAEQIAKPTERDARLAGFFVFPAIGRLVPFQLFEPSRRKRILAEGPGARVSASLADQVGAAPGVLTPDTSPFRRRGPPLSLSVAERTSSPPDPLSVPERGNEERPSSPLSRRERG